MKIRFQNQFTIRFILDKDYMVKGLGGPGFIFTDTSKNRITDLGTTSENKAGCFIESLFQ